ncbi:M3 family oligoendopeptidase [Deinococcus peraridilitoris]|uniref:Oligoendopeptidase F n=1 Tax=Deinococcus peraridilitoris (strain DSM 19664 / LMG 22246 / CIP 109416 / KR-200) TaxID=937777 RepID=L0A1E3_DEIPD|nr:M3 family oligoendopeptidase [Deinococcus peraridilitoris]AFZ67713.1 oligoendopeptidase F [Deinococcus peraridilitoris DSM 19664]
MTNTPQATHDWTHFEPRYQALRERPLDPAQVPAFLRDWSDLEKLVGDTDITLRRARDRNTADVPAEEAYLSFVREVRPKVQQASQELNRKLLAVEGYQPGENEVLMLRKLRTDAELYREENVELEVRMTNLVNEYYKLTGGLTVTLNGEELTLPQAQVKLLSPDRELRERTWRAMQDVTARIAPELDRIFLELLALRRQAARNAGFDNYRDYRWLQLKRFHYTPGDSQLLHQAIQAHVVPLVSRRKEAHRRQMNVESLRPWDLRADPLGREAIAAFGSIEELEDASSRIFHRLAPKLGEQFDLMRERGYLDLESRRNKAPGAYCASFPTQGVPFLHGNFVGTVRDASVLFHEAGHAFHVFASSRPDILVFARHPGAEFAEVASQSMELLTLPFLSRAQGGLYDEADLPRVREEQLDSIITFLPFAAVLDSFQHWVYTETGEDVSIGQLDAKWLSLMRAYFPHVNYDGLEGYIQKGWQYLHLYGYPLYYLDYAIAWLGAIQVWRGALADQQTALEQYLYALSLGGTRSLPELFEVAGTTLAFDEAHVGRLMAFLEEQYRA